MIEKVVKFIPKEGVEATLLILTWNTVWTIGTSYGAGVYSAERECRGFVQKGVQWGHGGLQKSSMEVYAGEGKWNESQSELHAILEDKVKMMSENAVAKTSKKAYLRAWEDFLSFTQRVNVGALPASVATVLWYLAFLEMTGVGGRANTHVAAISWRHRTMGVLDPTRDQRVKLALEGVRRLVAENKDEMIGQREPFPLEALRAWVQTERKSTSIREWRAPALVAVGIRCMRRPCEIAALKRKHIQWITGGVRIWLKKSKTNQLHSGRWMHMDAVNGSPTCPVWLLRQHMKTSRWQDDEDALFTNSDGRHMSVTSISAVVKNMVAKAKIECRVSGHSLRIAGATLAVKAGWEMADICAVGGWRSNSVLVYLRDSAVAVKKGSTSLGF